MKKRIKKKIKKLKKSINKINKVRVQKGRKAMLQETWATVTYGLYDNRKIRRLKKFPPALVENRMLFETNDDFTDNGRALFDYLIEKGYNKKYEIVWLVHEPSKYKEYQFENVKFVQNFKKGSTIRRAEAYKYALTSKYIFYTQAFNWIGMSRRNQLFIDLWHGCGYKANKNGRKVFFDYCLVPGDIFIKTKMEFFGCTSKKLLSFGYPRYDMMLKGSERADEYKNKLLKETDSEKLILWMPTYRHASSERLNEETLNNEFNIPIIDDADKLLELNKFCKENHILIVIKKHYLQVPYDFGENVLTNIVYLENRDLADNGLQLYEFINCSDALVSDTHVSWKPEFSVPLRHRSVHYNRVLPDDSVLSWFHIFLSIYMVHTRRKIHLLQLHNTEYTHLQSLILLLFSYSFPVYYKRFTTRRSIPDFINCSACSGIRSNVSSKANSEL